MAKMTKQLVYMYIYMYMEYMSVGRADYKDFRACTCDFIDP